MSASKRRIDVMVSSTTNDLGEHRRQLSPIITNLLLTPRMMDNDSATGKEGLTYSLALVDEAEIYILLLGFRYGYVPDDPRNPDKLSMTHLEYRRAKARQKRDGICVLAFLLEDKHKPEIVKPEMIAFREEVLKDQVKYFDDMADLKLAVQQALVQSPCVIDPASIKRSDDRPFSPNVGEILDGRYMFVEKLGQGGNGEVWKVHETLPDGEIGEVAIKLLTPEASAKPNRIERFKKEIGVTYRLKHAHIIRTTTWGEAGNQFYAVMDFINGQTFRDFIKDRRFSDVETVNYLSQIAEALNHAHKQNITHRDVKPENILVQDDKLYLGDFGLAISPDEDMSLTATGELVGTRKYMAPEQWDNQATSAQTDIYALGIIVYEMLTGDFPYDVSSHARLLTQHLHNELPTHAQLPHEILAILRRATAKQPEARYTDVIEFISELRHWRSDPANLETKISKYLDRLQVDLKGAVYEKLFVDLEGDIRSVLHQIERQPARSNRYADRYMDEFDGLMDEFIVEQTADHHQPDQAESRPVENIIQQLMTSQRVVLVGEPGSGKTFTLRRLVMAIIRQYEAGGKIPVFIALNTFKGETTLMQTIRDHMDDLAPYYDELQRNNRLILICDALNEMPRTAITDDRRDLVAEVRETLQAFPHFVVSCRVRDYKDDLNSLKLERLAVRDLDLPAIREFVKRYKLWFKYDDDTLWAKMGGSEELFTFWQAVKEKGETERFWRENSGLPSYTRSSDDNAWRKMWQGAKLIPLSRNPYLARVICGLHGQDKMPDNRAELYAAFVTVLYESEQEHASRRGQPFPEREQLDDFLTGLAEQMQAKGTTVLKSSTIDDTDLLHAGLDATILTQDGDDVRFTHQLLQEYFAARTLAVQMYDDQPLQIEAWWQENVWRETFLMFAEFVDDKVRAVRWLGHANPELAYRTWERVLPDTPLDTATKQALIDSAHAKASEPNPIGRASAYRALALLDADKRKGVSVIVRDGVKLPDIDWVTIPAGEFTYQDGKMTLDYEYQIARYPVTYAQFQAFVDATDGFYNPQWWEGLAIPDGHNKTVGEQRFKFANHPRERVSWYDAVAFCRWLSDKVGFEVRLPTEFEWEKAARGMRGWRYPYGDTFDTLKGNTGETGIGQTSAVGIFPLGDTPHWEKPISDLSGNVWEWCLSDYRHPQTDAGDENLQTDARRVLRGGSWDFDFSLARAVYRYDNDPLYRSFNYGFRLVARPFMNR